MGPSFWQILIIFCVILIVFGAGKLPKALYDLGNGLKNFNRALKEKDEENAEKK